MIAYLLIQTKAGAAAKVAAQIEADEGAESVNMVTGPYDVIARVRSDRITDTSEGVIELILALDEVLRVLVCHGSRTSWIATRGSPPEGVAGSDIRSVPTVLGPRSNGRA
jgi:hypothetical protein